MSSLFLHTLLIYPYFCPPRWEVFHAGPRFITLAIDRADLLIWAVKEGAMPDLHHLTLFMLASLTLLLIPGPAILYIVTQSLQQGTKAGLVSTTGIALGGLVHVFATAFGLSAILVASTSAFLIIKWTGAAYLIYLGLRTWLGPKKTESPEEKPTAPLALKKAFWRGVWVQVLNPKSAIFFMAFLPQF
ncbi:MAG: LysE family translocator, partial [Acidobacteria bacterium]|nr:LysE family translocator [Acidobacteriota bacterium]